jgi:hypothetical protein
MALRRQPQQEDFVKYQQILEETCDEFGVCHKDEAERLFASELVRDEDRAMEFALARAREVGDKFDKARSPDIEKGQMTFTNDSFINVGENERVRVDIATADHTRQWRNILDTNHARQSRAWAIKRERISELLDIQDEHKCSLWDAEMIIKGE